MWALLALAWFAFATEARAADAGQPFRLEYWAKGHCPDAAEFARQIQSRAPHLRLAEGDEPALGFYAELVEGGGSATGRLTARSPDGREVVREVGGQTCDDVVTALALIAALAMDPNQPATRPRARREQRHTVEPEAVVDSTPEPVSPLERWTYGVGGGLGFESAIAPSPGFGLDVMFEAEAPGGSALRPLLLVSAHRSSSPGTQTEGGTVALTWLALRSAVCPLRWPEQTPLYLRACGFLDIGALQGSASNQFESHSATHTWFAGGGFGRLEAMVGDVAFELDGGVAVPFLHQDFGVPNQALAAFSTPGSGALGRIGLSYRFQ